jgi:hypothetical protein
MRSSLQEPLLIRINGTGRRRKHFLTESGMEPTTRFRVVSTSKQEGRMRSGLLWLIGVPIPIIIILWLLTGHA